MTAGFTITGDSPKTVLVRAIGPTLARFGVGYPLADPRLTLFVGGNAVATNDGWGSADDNHEVAEAFVTTGAFLLPDGSKDAAVLLTLNPGTYTAQVTAANGGAGNVLIEVYDVESEPKDF
jgi:hypothetical protein